MVKDEYLPEGLFILYNENAQTGEGQTKIEKEEIKELRARI